MRKFTAKMLCGAVLILSLAAVMRIVVLPPVQAEPTAQKPDNLRSALVLALRGNLQYSRSWLEAKDFKSLEQSAGSLAVLAQALGRHTTDNGSDKIAALARTIEQLSTAARGAKLADAQSALAALEKAAGECAELPAADPPRPVGRMSAGFRPLMFLIDGTYADAKTAVAVGDAAEAQSYVVVLAELARWLEANPNNRTEPGWQELSAHFLAAAEAAADADAADLKSFTAKLRQVYSSCEACHQRRRPQR